MSALDALYRQTARYRPRPKLVAAVDKAALLHRATLSLAEERPHLSARQVVTSGQTIFFGVLATAFIAEFLVWPAPAADIVVAGMAIGFVASLVPSLYYSFFAVSVRRSSSLKPSSSARQMSTTIFL